MVIFIAWGTDTYMHTYQLLRQKKTLPVKLKILQKCMMRSVLPLSINLQVFFIVHDRYYFSAMEEEELQVALAISASLTDQEVEIVESSR